MNKNNTPTYTEIIKKVPRTHRYGLFSELFWQGHKDLNRPDGLLSFTFVKQTVPFPAVPGTFSYHKLARLTTRHLPRKGKDKGKL